MEHHSISIFDIFPIPTYLSATFFVALLMIGSALLIRRSLLRSLEGAVVPDERLTVRNVFEILIEGLGYLMHQTMGPEARRYLPLIATLGIFLLLANLVGLVPGLAAATGDRNPIYAWAILVFISYNAIGFKKHGWGYLKQFAGPFFGPWKIGPITIPRFPVLFWFIGPIELVSHAIRMGTLTIRLLGNIFADHLLVFVMIGLVPAMLPALFIGFGFLVAVVQAFVFTMLSIVYIALALEEAEH